MKPTNPCILVERHVLHKEKDAASTSNGMKKRWACKLQGEDIVKAKGQMVELDGIDDSVFDEDNHIRSGFSTLMIEGAVITSEMKMKFPIGSVREIGKAKHPKGKSINQRELSAFDTGKTEHRELNPGTPNQAYSLLVLRVTTKDSEPTSSKSILSDVSFRS